MSKRSVFVIRHRRAKNRKWREEEKESPSCTSGQYKEK